MLGKSLAAALLGLPLSTALVGLFALLWPGSLKSHTLAWLVMFFPIWIGCMALAFACRNGPRAWAWLGGATLLCFGLLFLIKALGWTELSQ